MTVTWFRRSRYVTWDTFEDALTQLRKEINLMASQSDVDAITAQIGQVATDLQTVQDDLQGGVAKLQAELDQLASANPSIDLSALQSRAGSLDTTVQALDAAVQAAGSLVPDAPAPPAGS